MIGSAIRFPYYNFNFNSLAFKKVHFIGNYLHSWDPCQDKPPLKF